MKYLKMLGLAAIAVLAFAAFAGASASAAVLCKEAPNKAGECPTTLGDYAANTVFNAESTNSKLTVTGSSVVSSVSCTSSTMEFENTATEGVPTDVTDLIWSGCTDNNGNSCSISTTSGYTGSITPSTLDNGNGTLTVNGSAKTTVQCGGPEFFLCKYTLAEPGLTFSLFGGNPASFTASSQTTKLAEASFGCGTDADFSAKYTLKAVNGSPTALWIATRNT